MKYIIFLTISASFLFASYNYTTTNSGKIDMHGGKSTSLVGESSLKDKNFKSLKDLTQPPVKKETEKDKKEENGK